MADILVDTDVLIDHLRGERRLRRPARSELNYSVITRCELAAGSAEQQDEVRRLLSTMRERVLDGATAEAGGMIRRQTGIATPDALIAATAISSGLELATRNRSDFERVDGLRIVSSDST